MPIRQTTLALFGLALLALPASAQVRTVNQSCLVGGQRGTGVTQIATDCPIGRAPALMSFRFGFFNGDHKFRQATLMPNGDTFEAAWGDSGGEDPYFVEARWLRIPEATGGVVTAVVRGIADIPIPAGPPNTTLVLSGFEFKRADGTDNNVRTMAIDLDGPSHTIRTVLIDDEGADYTNLALAIGVGFAIGAAGAPDPNLSFEATNVAQSLLNRPGVQLVPGMPTHDLIPAEQPAVVAAVAPPAAPAAAPPASTSGRAGAVVALRPNVAIFRPLTLVQPAQVSSNTARPYLVRVAYAWVPNTRLANGRAVSGSGRNRAEGVSGSFPARGTPYVIQGFSFSYGNSDHYISDFGIHLWGGAPVQTTVPASELVSWEDADRGDPMQWRVRIANLR